MIRSKKYVIDLQATLAECEANYFRLQKLLPDSSDQASYDVAIPGHKQVNMHFEVKERCKFTTMLTLEQSSESDWLYDTHFDLRIYHDAKMVEVVGFQRQKRVKPSYEYPNEKMFQSDEKQQQNRFLSECLENCLKNGLSRKEYAFA